MMSDETGKSRWICHVCDCKGEGESIACSVCFKTTCSLHIRHVPTFNPASGLFELQPVCLHCAVSKAAGIS